MLYPCNSHTLSFDLYSLGSVLLVMCYLLLHQCSWRRNATRVELLEPHACGVVAFVGTVACFLLCKVPFILCYSGLLIRVQNGSLDEKSETYPYVSTNFPVLSWWPCRRLDISHYRSHRVVVHCCIFCHFYSFWLWLYLVCHTDIATNEASLSIFIAVASSPIGRLEFECNLLHCIFRLSLLDHHYICYKETYFIFRTFQYTQSTIRCHPI
jgi:hypothetical protein